MTRLARHALSQTAMIPKDVRSMYVFAPPPSTLKIVPKALVTAVLLTTPDSKQNNYGCFSITLGMLFSVLLMLNWILYPIYSFTGNKSNNAICTSLSFSLLLFSQLCSIKEKNRFEVPDHKTLKQVSSAIPPPPTFTSHFTPVIPQNNLSLYKSRRISSRENG